MKAVLWEVRISFGGAKQFFGIVRDAPEDIYLFPDSNGDMCLHQLRMYDPACTEDDYGSDRPVEVEISDELKPFTKEGVIWCASFRTPRPETNPQRGSLLNR
jgi:hypothetical protein